MGSENGSDGDVLVPLRRFLKEHRADIATIVLYSVAVGILVLATPITVQALVNSTAFGTVLQPIIVLAALLLGGLTFAGCLRALKAILVEVLQRRMFVRVTAQLAYRLPRADPSTRLASDPIHRFLELFGAQKAAATLLLGGIDMALSASVGMLVLAFYHPLLLAFDAGLLLALLLLVFVAGRRGVDSAIAESAAKLELSDFLAHLTRVPYVYRGQVGRRYARGRIDVLAQRYLNTRSSHFRVVMRQVGGSLALQAVASASLLGLGGFLVINRELTLGQLVAAELIVSAVLASLSNLGKYAESYYDLVAHLDKLHGLLSTPLEPDEGTEISEHRDKPCELVLDDVHFSLGGQALLAGASCTVAAGARVVLAGPAESGKSSLLELLFGLQRQQRGRILIDGVDTRELSRSALRQRVALIRGAEIVPGTVIENVRLGDDEITAARVRTLLDALGLADELGRLPRGFETQLGPYGERLSDSQQLRLTLARALIRAPGLVAIDADLGALDAASRECVARVLTAPAAPWTLLIVGNPSALSDLASTLMVLQGGQLTGEASNDAA